MNWVTKYWDALEQLYWTPKYLGLKSIPKTAWGTDPDVIHVPRDQLEKGGSIYTRDGNWPTNNEKMRGLEETLNHIFDITVAIAPDSVIYELFHKPAEIDDKGPFECVGREISARYGWGNANVTQQDGLFVSSRSILNVELKLGSKTWREQVLKYLMISLLEEKIGGKRSNIGLLYITPHAGAEVMEQAGADANGQLPARFVSEFDPAKLNAITRKMIQSDFDGLVDIASRIRLTHISWADLVNNCQTLIASLDLKLAGDQTLARLLQGFIEAVQEHRGTGV